MLRRKTDCAKKREGRNLNVTYQKIDLAQNGSIEIPKNHNFIRTAEIETCQNKFRMSTSHKSATA